MMRNSAPARRYENNCFRQKAGLLAVIIAGMVILTDASVVLAAESGIKPFKIEPFPLAQVFTFMFIMIGPFKIIGPFSKMTKNADADFVRQLALRATLYSSLALLLAAILGDFLLGRYGIPLPVLSLAAGIILFLVALLNIVRQFAPVQSDTVTDPKPTMSMALTPLAFPTIVTPYGIAALVVFLAFSQDLQGQLMIGVVVLAIMILNLIVMILTPKIPLLLGTLLQILGVVLGVIQVALGLQIAISSLRVLEMV